MLVRPVTAIDPPLPTQASPPTSVLLAGGTGLVGRALLPILLDDGRRTVRLLLRRPAAEPLPAGARALVVDFAALPPLPSADEACCALGTTLRQAGSKAAFRAVDHDAVLAFARAARAAGVRRLAVVSALGADPASGSFYNRVKGETEQALQQLGFESLVIARPSLLDGQRSSLGQPARPAEALALAATRPIARWLPKAWRPITPRQVARAMVRALALARPGVTVLSSSDMQEEEP